jgi:hypothetical protein
MFTEESCGWRQNGAGGDDTDDDEAVKRKKVYCTRKRSYPRQELKSIESLGISSHAPKPTYPTGSNIDGDASYIHNPITARTTGYPSEAPTFKMPTVGSVTQQKQHRSSRSIPPMISHYHHTHKAEDTTTSTKPMSPYTSRDLPPTEEGPDDSKFCGVHCCRETSATGATTKE